MGWPKGVGPSSGGGQFTATLARGVIQAAPGDVFSLFNDNELVPEYNEFCKEISDVLTLDDDTRLVAAPMNKMLVHPFIARSVISESRGP